MSVMVPMKRRRSSSSSSEPELPLLSLPHLVRAPLLGNAFDLCLCVTFVDSGGSRSLRWLMLNIPASIIRSNLLAPAKFSIQYAQHNHMDNGLANERFLRCTMDPEVNGSFLSGLPLRISSNVIGSTVYCLGSGDDDFTASKRDGHDLCRHFQFWNLREGAKPKWKKGRPLICPRNSPVVVASMGKLYVFGSNCSSADAFAEMFDPDKGHWEELPVPPIGKISDNKLIVTPLGGGDFGEIMVLDKDCGIPCAFDVVNGWKYLDLPNLSHHLLDMNGKPVVVREENTLSLYWLNQFGNLCTYDLTNKVYVEGVLFGLDHEGIFTNVRSVAFNLLHLCPSVFLLVWDDLSVEPSVTFHVTVIQVFKTFASLIANVVGCFSYHSDDTMFLEDAYLLSYE